MQAEAAPQYGLTKEQQQQEYSDISAGTNALLAQNGNQIAKAAGSSLLAQNAPLTDNLQLSDPEVQLQNINVDLTSVPLPSLPSLGSATSAPVNDAFTRYWNDSVAQLTGGPSPSFAAAFDQALVAPENTSPDGWQLTPDEVQKGIAMQEAQSNPSLAQMLGVSDAELEHTAAVYAWTQSPTVNGLESMANSGAYVFAGALNAVAQPFAQAVDLGQVAFGGIHNLFSSEPYQLTPFSTIANSDNFGDALRQGLQYNPLGATALGGYDLTTGTINGNGTQALSGGLSLASAFVGADLVPSGEAAALTGTEGLASSDRLLLTSAQQRQFQMLQENVGYNISPLSWDAYPTLGRQGTYLTDQAGALGYFGDLNGQTSTTISSAQAAQIETDLGLEPGSLQDGFKVRQVSGITEMTPTSPLEGNRYFLGAGQHLPSGAPELVVNPIPTVDTHNVQTTLTVYVK